MGFLGKVVDLGIDGWGPFAGAAEVAATARARTATTDEAISAVIALHVRAGAVGGFVTGLGGFVALPVAVPVNVFEFSLLATRMVAAVADLRGYDIKSVEVRTAVVLTLAGSTANEMLQQTEWAVAASSGALGSLVLNRLPKTALLVVNKAIGFRVLRSIGERTLSRVGRLAPVAGGVLGAGMDGYLMRQVAQAARREFPVGLG